MKNTKVLNDKLIYLLEKHNVRPAELARALNIHPTVIYNVKYKKRALGEELFIKILRKGFRLREKEARKIFIKAVEEKYLDDPDFKA